MNERSHPVDSTGLSTRDFAVLSLIESDAELLASEVAENLGTSPHGARYSVRKLKEHGIIGRRFPYVNMYALGLTEYFVFFSFGGESLESKERFIAMLMKLPTVTWILRTVGEFDLEITLCLKSSMELKAALEEISELAERIITKKSFAIRLHLTRFKRNYLSDSVGKKIAFSYGADSPVLDRSRINERVYDYIATNGYNTLKEISTNIDLPIATVEYHKTMLEDLGVFTGYFYRVNVRQWGMQSVRFLLETSGIGSELRGELTDFCRKSKWIFTLQEWAGDFDYMVGADVYDLDTVAEITSEIYNRFGRYVSDIKTLLVLNVAKAVQYVQ